MCQHRGIACRRAAGETAALTSGWRATINNRDCGDDILHAVPVDRFVIESTMWFFGPVAERRDEAGRLSALLVEQFLLVHDT